MVISDVLKCGPKTKLLINRNKCCMCGTISRFWRDGRQANCKSKSLEEKFTDPYSPSYSTFTVGRSESETKLSILAWSLCWHESTSSNQRLLKLYQMQQWTNGKVSTRVCLKIVLECRIIFCLYLFLLPKLCLVTEAKCTFFPVSVIIPTCWRDAFFQCDHMF